jgi:REP element-mobilizing transposase RayT
MSGYLLDHPPHAYLDNSYYFITSRTLVGKVFNTDAKKQFIYFSIAKALKRYEFGCLSWVILDNHYQLVVRTKLGKDLGSFIRYINARSANLLIHDYPQSIKENPLQKVEINRGYTAEYKKNIVLHDSSQFIGDHTAVQIKEIPSRPEYYNKIWYQYWDTPLETTDQIIAYTNYNHLNPIKHGYMENLGELNKYKWSSYNQYIIKYGMEWMIECFERYPLDLVFSMVEE